MWPPVLNNNSRDSFFDNTGKDWQDVKNKLSAQMIVPVMINQLVFVSSSDKMEFLGMPVRMFSILGIVQSIEKTATKISYNVGDETGTITALKWLEANKKASDVTVKENTYVRFIGLIKKQNDERYFLILHMWPLEDFNELTSHVLEVIYIKLKSEAMNKAKIEQGSQSGLSEDSSHYGLTVYQFSIYKIIQAHNNTEFGIKRSEIKNQVPEIIRYKIDELLESLLSEGLIYSTSTEDCFKTI